MKWSSEQQHALDSVSKWHSESPEQVFRLFGYAGTGKTTLARHFAEGVSGQVYFGAFTGKAAYVLRQKGCPGASTIHSLIYKPKDKSKLRLRDLEDSLIELISELRREGLTNEQVELRNSVIKIRTDIAQEKKNLARPAFSLDFDSPIRSASLVIIDECSMVDERIGEDLLSFGTPILVLGDPAQLPPVRGAGYFTNQKPDIMLSQIHRQAQDSPIIRLATEVRNQKPLSIGQYGTSRVVNKEYITPKVALAADQILVGTNVFRGNINHRIRELLGYDSVLPINGDKLVCLRNDHDLGLLNGGLWQVIQSIDSDDERLALELKSEDGEYMVACEAHSAHFLGRELSWWEKREAQEFDYGYALTVHKSQGSQWDNIIVFDQSQSFRQSKWKWLYTAITRAAEQVIIVQ